MTADSAACRPTIGGFTLIEVVGALLVFSIAVIMLLQITTGLGRQVEYSAINSLITAEGRERLDSLDVAPYASIGVGEDVDTLSVRGVSYRLTQTVSQYTSLVRKVDVVIEPIGDSGPRFEASTYVTGGW